MMFVFAFSASQGNGIRCVGILEFLAQRSAEGRKNGKIPS